MPLGANKAAIMGVAGTAAAADVVLLSEGAFTNQTTVSFTSEITSTYGEYIFGFYNISPASDSVDFQFQVNADGESGYNETITSTSFMAHGYEDGGGSSMNYQTAEDQANGTAFQTIADIVGNGADESLDGHLHLFNPSSTTYVKHFYARLSYYGADNSAKDSFPAGYFNFTAALTNVRFKFASGNFDGEIKLWGVK